MLNGLRKSQDIIKLKLTAYRAGEVFIDCVLNKTKFLIGDHKNSDLIIPDKSVSHYHAFLFIDSDGGAKIIDLGSRNGVYINGKKIKDAYISAGDELTIGSVQFHVLEDISNDLIEDQDGKHVIQVSE